MNTCIIIATYNGMKWLEKCLSSIPHNYSVIIVDNSSTDGTQQFLKNYSRDLLLLFQKENLGFGQANNLGIKHALSLNTNAVFLLNQDAYLHPDTIELLEKAHQQYPAYGVLSPIHLDAGKKKMDRNFSYYLSYDQNSSFYSDCFFNSLNDIYEVPFVNAAGWFIPITTINKIGGFDPLFFHYGEDDNYCQRLQYHNLKIAVVTKSLMIHDRANRKNKYIEPFSEQSLLDEIKKIKLNVSNINKNDGLFQLEKKIKQYRKLLLRNRVLRRKKQAKYYETIFLYLSNHKLEIIQSYTLNKNEGLNYLR